MCESNGDGQKHHCSFQTDYNPIATNTIMKKKQSYLIWNDAYQYMRAFCTFCQCVNVYVRHTVPFNISQLKIRCQCMSSSKAGICVCFTFSVCSWRFSTLSYRILVAFDIGFVVQIIFKKVSRRYKFVEIDLPIFENQNVQNIKKITKTRYLND